MPSIGAAHGTDDVTATKDTLSGLFDQAHPEIRDGQSVNHRLPLRVLVWAQGFDRDNQAVVILERADGSPFTHADAQRIAAALQEITT